MVEVYLDREELSKILKIPATSVDYYRKKKGMPHIRIGRHNRYLLSDVMDWSKGNNN
ncbi:MAG: helix-turn-helix domain-containing protein [Candidatus Omnitrophica bacterium]|nr:helix-turn-helix domain-containing protein [Candidatus Omnitrophota bacterium]